MNTDKVLDVLIAALELASEVGIHTAEVNARREQRIAEGLPGLTDEDTAEFRQQARSAVGRM